MKNLGRKGAAAVCAPIGKFAVLALMALPASCTDGTVDVGGSDGASRGFSVTVGQDWSDQGQAPAGSRACRTSGYVLDTDGSLGGAPLYVTVTETDGMDGKGCREEVPCCDASTRGVLMGASMFHGDFSLYGTGGSASNERVSKAGGGYKGNVAFPSDGSSVTLYGIAPYSAAGYAGMSAAGKTFSYQTPATATQQKDVMAGTATASSSSNVIPVDFRHVLSAVKFKIGGKGIKGNVKITKIAITGIHTMGNYSFDTNAWTHTGTGSVEQTFNFTADDSHAQGSCNAPVTSDAAGTTFLLLPQTLPSGARIAVTVQDGTATKVIRTDIGGKSWTMGHTVTYGIQSSKELPGFILTVEPAPKYSHLGETHSFKVKSYQNNTAKTPVSWQIDGYQYSEDDGKHWSTWSSGGTRPYFLNHMSVTSGAGGQSGNDVPATIQAQVKKLGLHTAALENEPEVAGYDLSKHDLARNSCAMTTANCYIVHAAGSYKLPLVIGNTVKNGNVNIYSGTGSEIFVNYQDQKVTAANYMIENAATACVVWSDAKDMSRPDDKMIEISSAPFTTEGGYTYLNFTVKKSMIRQSNTVVAVKDNAGKVIWSWNIWCTDEDMHKPIPVYNAANRLYNLSPLTVGAVNNSEEWAGRRIRVRLKQPSTGVTAVTELVQRPHSINHYTSAIYEWGRKDAMPGNANYQGTWKGKTSTVYTYGMTIQNPDTECLTTKHPVYQSNTTPFYRVWSAEMTDFAQAASFLRKTIYDPCPAGYCVANYDTFTGFNVQRIVGYDYVHNPTEPLTHFWNGGYYFYGDNTKNEDNIILFPAVGDFSNTAGTSPPHPESTFQYWTNSPARPQNYYHGSHAGYMFRGSIINSSGGNLLGLPVPQGAYQIQVKGCIRGVKEN